MKNKVIIKNLKRLKELEESKLFKIIFKGF